MTAAEHEETAADIAFAGRSQMTDALADLPSETRTALSSLADFFNTPLEAQFGLPLVVPRMSRRGVSGMIA